VWLVIAVAGVYNFVRFDEVSFIGWVFAISTSSLCERMCRSMC
jgi:hypothetical protein